LLAGRVNPAVLGGGFADTDDANHAYQGADLMELGINQARIAVSELCADCRPVGTRPVSGTGDVDIYRLNLHKGQVLSAMTAPLGDLSMTFDVPDTKMALFNGSVAGPPGLPLLPFAKIIENDDAGNFNETDEYAELASDSPFVPFGVYGSAFRIRIPSDGVYYLAVSGFGDADYNGFHDQVGRYALLVGVAVPEPNSFCLAVHGVLGLAGRRRGRGRAAG
jgi:hypothetical protein